MTSLGIIGGADGATAVFVSGVFVTGSDPKFWAMLALNLVLLLGSLWYTRHKLVQSSSRT